MIDLKEQMIDLKEQLIDLKEQMIHSTNDTLLNLKEQGNSIYPVIKMHL